MRRNVGSMSRGLSTREQRIAQLVSEGSTNRDIARALDLSDRTVEWNLTRVYRKLGVRSRAQLAALVAGRGVAETPWAERPIAESDNVHETGKRRGEGKGS